MTASLPDPRTNPYRPDLAAAHLQGIVQADRFIEGVPCQVRAGFATVKGSPDFEARQTTQALFGETVTVYEEHDGWVWGQLSGDGYVGYLRLDTLWEETPEPTHQVTALRSFLFPEPDLKTPPLDVLSLTTRVAIAGERNGFVELAQGGWVFAGHLDDLAAYRPDYVATSRRLPGVPYLWGGKTSLGLDCSGLVQIALAAAGIAAPRDSDQQGGTLGQPVPEGETLRSGDLIFFPGHVGIMTGPEQLIHANAFHMMVTEEPLSDVVARGARITGMRRL
ncbi:C40 family peptidase [Skermanella mucosa]|uniref:C40 family peptidase n=1 Tax=Skermanella mucosa TaxID=1789672 RepID=UPI00192B752E|nr:NlpC/P60 family protein [Skermanella mucosa]UEM20275.1 C40 family peptidase [Skermanella mucosa]